MKPIFTADQFTPTEFTSAADKAKFANHFVRFVESGYKRTLFPKWFYTWLSMTFGHIAHYDQSRFYATFFTNPEGVLRFYNHIANCRCYGEPSYTFSDVERALQIWFLSVPTSVRIGGWQCVPLSPSCGTWPWRF